MKLISLITILNLTGFVFGAEADEGRGRTRTEAPLQGTLESLNANVRHYLARFRRKTRCYSKCPKMVELSLFLLFYKDLFKCLF